MYEVVEAKIEEIPAMTLIAKSFEDESKFVNVNYAHTVETYTEMVESGFATVFLLKKDGEIIGGLGAIKHPDLHEGILVGVETFWFVSPEHRGPGLMLFDAFEEWGAKNGCVDMAMIHMVDSHPKALKRLYRMKGYELAEEHYIKRGKRP